MQTFIPIAFLFAFCAALSSVGQAAEISTKGTAFYVATGLSHPTEPRLGLKIVPLNQSGILRDDDPASPLNLSTHDCTGTLVMRGDSGTALGAGTCIATDKDGDVWWLFWTSDGKTGGTWQAMSGTGKYEGLSGSGTTTFIANFPDLSRSARSYAGSLTLK